MELRGFSAIRQPKTYLLSLLLFIAIASARPQEIPWPGPAYLTASSWEALLAVPIATAGSQMGFGAKAGFFAEGIKPLAGLGAGLAFSYSWLRTEGRSITPIIGAGTEFSYRIPVASLFSIRPKLELGAAYSPSASGGTWSADLSAGLGLAFLLGGRNYAVLTPALRWTPSFGGKLAFSLSLGSRTETAWMRMPPAVALKASGVPALYSPDGDGLNDAFDVALACRNPKQVASWSIAILDAREEKFLTRSGLGAPPADFSWDGVSDDGRQVDPASDYRFVFEAVDTLGRKSTAASPFIVDILVIKMGERYKIRVPSILFPSNSADLAGAEWMVKENGQVLSRLVALFARFPEYSIVVEGHANSQYWQSESSYSAEQKNELVPLSRSRAASVRAALVSMGIASGRIEARGIGGAEPIVPFADAENAWKNRRVEFILVKAAKE